MFQRRRLLSLLTLLPVLAGLPRQSAAQSLVSTRGDIEDSLDVPARRVNGASQRPLMAVHALGDRLVAVGMRGLILVSQDGGRNWTQSDVPVQSDLVAIHFRTANKGWAVGHDGVVLHSVDGGSSWIKQFDGRKAGNALVEHYTRRIQQGQKGLQLYLAQVELNFKRGQSVPYLGVWFRDANSGYAVGPFGTLIETNDGGNTWLPALDKIDNDSFLHLNALHEVDRQVYIPAEKGTLFRLNRAAGRFHDIRTGYEGSFFGVVGHGRSLLAYGLRGTIYRSTDDGMSWSSLPRAVNGTYTGGIYVSKCDVFVLSTSEGDLVTVDVQSGHTERIGKPSNAMITSLAALPDGSIAYTGMGGVAKISANAIVSSTTTKLK
ncbi:WD40/YVTN/BNR-like repeat-containing protein [Noviherbaspirillum saxi]|uniref:Glycosyl hydrolase n=1 Tax=Noviherbaspirillum saxi TaxID=2320863 RepID=A0A3A3FG55_9BURK|nr:YCF48-related protein [Noviherbaspirillum saxi]RJF92351.1 glycosyl hydrolase [Noviherbaspirillum saxi]